jgi:hypothetical protein
MNSSVSPSLKMGEERIAKIRIQNIAGNDDVIIDGLTTDRRILFFFTYLSGRQAPFIPRQQTG